MFPERSAGDIVAQLQSSALTVCKAPGRSLQNGNQVVKRAVSLLLLHWTTLPHSHLVKEKSVSSCQNREV